MAKRTGTTVRQTIDQIFVGRLDSFVDEADKTCQP